MRRRHPVPTLWLMTDERMGDDLWRAVRRLPRGAGIVFRHHATPQAERRRLFARLLRVARARGLVLVRAGDARMAGEMGVHRGLSAGLVTWPVHDRREAQSARRAGAGAAFVSPVFATRSHPGASSLGARGAARLARTLPMARIALGGMDARRLRALHGFDGWAAIDAWLR
ncbi:thiamine phosphate synthase [Sphingomonas mucosissima]|uniref:Thiamine phosphate synthase/TenI domain-containing protein n=1 Tax=Sphingomonas mucosissima TaxID=370959 RepID=A0A245ZHE4_9SPHN|nr:thiamine phosphate synthase [Sphingomonas mucosissima]OWK29157.1 hypothetical protein SPMU_26840 [Sphingomonas mucosissima]